GEAGGDAIFRAAAERFGRPAKAVALVLAPAHAVGDLGGLGATGFDGGDVSVADELASPAIQERRIVVVADGIFEAGALLHAVGEALLSARRALALRLLAEAATGGGLRAG